MGIINFSIPKDLVLSLIKASPIENFVETGTYKGETCFWAAQHFNKVYTIEIDPTISSETAGRIDTPRNIEFLVGDSKYALKKLTKNLTGSAFFWLDGHWCSGAGGKDEECPLMDEIEAISEINHPIIFIDDARCFLGPLPPPHNCKDWPTFEDIFLKMKKIFPNNFITIIDDVIISIPYSLKEVVDEYWMNSYNSRFKTTSGLDLLKTTPKKQIVKHLLGIK